MNTKLSHKLLKEAKNIASSRAKTAPGEFPNCPFIFHQPKRPVKRA